MSKKHPTAEELIAYSLGREDLPINACYLTFDDGYKDHIEYVMPELLARNIQGSFFPPAYAIEKREMLDVNAIHFILASTLDTEGLVIELNQALAVPGNESEYSDIVKTLNEKISVFKKFEDQISSSGGFFSYPSNLYKLGTLYYVPDYTQGITQDNSVEIQEINYDELLDYYNSPLTKPNKSRPLYIRREEDIRIISAAAITSGVLASYTKKPSKVEWGYVVTNEQALYNASSSNDFELHVSEEVTLVMKILGLAGIVIQRQELMALGQQA